MRTELELIRNAAANNGGTIEISRAAVDGDTTAMSAAIPKGTAPLDIVGKAPVWLQMGVDHNPEAVGTYILPYQSPIVAEKVAELAPLTGDNTTPTGILVSPARFSASKTLTVESIVSAGDQYLTKLLEDLETGCDRKISAEVYAKILAGADTVSGAGLDKQGFNALMAAAEIEMDGAFFAHRATFFEAAGTSIDTGSGVFLAKMDSPDKGLTSDGVNFFYSELFSDPSGEKYVAYGDPSRIHVAVWGLEVVVDKMTKAATGQVVFTVNKLACVALTNPTAFSKSKNLVS